MLILAIPKKKMFKRSNEITPQSKGSLNKPETLINL